MEFDNGPKAIEQCYSYVCGVRLEVLAGMGGVKGVSSQIAMFIDTLTV